MTTEQKTALSALRQKTLREAAERMTKEGEDAQRVIMGQSPFVLTPEGWLKLGDDLAKAFGPGATWRDDVGEQERIDTTHAWLYETGHAPDEEVGGWLDSPSTE